MPPGKIPGRCRRCPHCALRTKQASRVLPPQNLSGCCRPVRLSTARSMLHAPTPAVGRVVHPGPAPPRPAAHRDGGWLDRPVGSTAHCGRPCRLSTEASGLSSVERGAASTSESAPLRRIFRSPRLRAPRPATAPRTRPVHYAVGTRQHEIRVESLWSPAPARLMARRAPSPAGESVGYLRILVTRPAPTVRPPSRIANLRPSSIAIGWISWTVMLVLSPGMTISVPSGSVTTPVTSVVRK
jgi:hypothetical protein